MVRLREVLPEDLDVHFEQQRDPESVALAAVPARDREAFDAHWKKILADPESVIRSIVLGDDVVGSAVSWRQDERRMVGYWTGREFWGRGIASAALAALLGEIEERPLHASVAAHNGASRRVLEKAGFRVVEEEPGVLLLRLG